VIKQSDSGVEMTPIWRETDLRLQQDGAITGLTLSSRREDILLALIKGLIRQLADGMDDFAEYRDCLIPSFIREAAQAFWI